MIGEGRTVAESSFADSVAGELRKDRRAHRLRVRVVSGIAAVVLLAAAVVVVVSYRYSCGFGNRLARAGLTGTCYGVTDGSYVFARDLAGLERLIRKENRSVESGPHVTVAYYTPMAVTAADVTSAESIRNDVAGAFAAQYRVNHSAVIGDGPKIRLVLADPGSRATHWKSVADELVRMSRSDDNLVAVTGLGVSRRETRNLVAALSRNHIAMVGSLITSTDLDATAFPGFVRVAPTNRDEARAAVAYLPDSVRTAMLVQDRDAGDDYVRTLGAEFSLQFRRSAPGGRRLVGQVETYDGTLTNTGGRFAQITGAYCAVRPDVVYFAGRGTQLREFVRALGHRSCADQPVTVLSGDDASQVASGDHSVDEEVSVALTGAPGIAPATLVYTALANSDSWRDQPNSIEARNYGDFVATLRSLHIEGLSSPQSLADGHAMMSHDAVFAAVTAIRGTLPQGTQVPVPTAEEVTQNLAGLHGGTTVPGASGTIEIDNVSGNPIDKPMPIVQLRGDGTVSFVRLASPVMRARAG